MSGETTKFKPYTRANIHQISQWDKIPADLRQDIDIVSRVLPFRVNTYVLDNLIDWNNIPDDPIYRLTFPHRDMLSPYDYQSLAGLIEQNDTKSELNAAINRIRMQMNPHPAGQMTHNNAILDGVKLLGVQHKYSETVLFFPAAGQSCHAYCTFCFRWPQFVGMEDLKFNARSSEELIKYLRKNKSISDVLITGGDPMVMNVKSLTDYIEPLLSDDLSHIQNIRIGTKSVAYWPQRYISDVDADDLMRLFERIVKKGRNLAIMAHFNHASELRPQIARDAIRRIVGTGASVRVQAPLVRHINEDPNSWIELWTESVRLGAVPYYMFVERDTGPSEYFRLPLVKAYEIFTKAYSSVSGLSRTVRGPSMSAMPGKVIVSGITEINGEKVFALQFLQARNPLFVNKPFFAKYDPDATWLDQLKPAFDEDYFFFEDGYSQGRAPQSIRKMRDENNQSAAKLDFVA